MQVDFEKIFTFQQLEFKKMREKDSNGLEGICTMYSVTSHELFSN